MNLNEQLNQAYNAGRRQALNEQRGMAPMSQGGPPIPPGTPPDDGNPPGGPMPPMGPPAPKPFNPTINDPEVGPLMPVGNNIFVDAHGQYWTWDRNGKRFVRSKY